MMFYRHAVACLQQTHEQDFAIKHMLMTRWCRPGGYGAVCRLRLRGKRKPGSFGTGLFVVFTISRCAKNEPRVFALTEAYPKKSIARRKWSAVFRASDAEKKRIARKRGLRFFKARTL
jgi:hypothetical protein